MELLQSSTEHNWVTTAYHSWTPQCPPQLNIHCLSQLDVHLSPQLDTPVSITAGYPLPVTAVCPLPITSHSPNPKALLGDATIVPSTCAGAPDAHPWQSLLRGVVKSALEAGWALAA